MALGEAFIEGFVERFVKNGYVLGIGAGEHDELFLKKIAVYATEHNMSISVVPSSIHIANLLARLGIPIASINDREIDLAIEFVSQVDEEFNYIKRDSLSLVRDKMIGQSAAELIVLTKKENYVKKLNGIIPFEICPFGWKHSLVRLDEFGKATIRRKADGEFVQTETGNYLVDVEIDEIYSLEDLEFDTKEVPGVLESGLFLHYADRVILHNGKVEMKSRIGPELEARDEE